MSLWLKVAAWLIGLLAFGGLVVLAAAGVTAAIGVMVTAFALVAMIGLGSSLRPHSRPVRDPYPSSQRPRPGQLRARGTGGDPAGPQDTGAEQGEDTESS